MGLTLVQQSFLLRTVSVIPLCGRTISFDGFVNYEGRRFGVPYTYGGKTVRVMRNGSCLYIYSADMARLLATHEVT